MSAVKSAERSRILATLAERPGLTAYEVARVLGYGKPQRNQAAQLVARMHQAGGAGGHRAVPAVAGPSRPSLTGWHRRGHHGSRGRKPRSSSRTGASVT